MYVHLPNRSLGYKTQLHDFHIPINNKGQLFSVLQMTHISFFLHELSTYGNKIMKYCSINCNYHYKFTSFFLI